MNGHKISSRFWGMIAVRTILTPCRNKSSSTRSKRLFSLVRPFEFITMIPSSSAAAAPPPPLSPYGTFTGDLFQYARNLVAFESPPPAAADHVMISNNKCILIGGLSDGLIPVPYTAGLQHVCRDTGWSLVQPVLSSSYTGFGHGSLDQDVDELVELVTYLSVHRQATRICLVGHSTGCQDICHLLRTKHGDKCWTTTPTTSGVTLAGAVLQAPVSDREQPAATDPDAYTANLALAQRMCTDGKADECMPRAAFWAPITAQRFLDLQAVGGTDDYFSSDYTEPQLAERLQAAGEYWPDLHMLVAFSGADEYLKPGLDTVAHTARLTAACNAKRPGTATALHLPACNHNLSEGGEEINVFLQHVTDLLVKAKGD